MGVIKRQSIKYSIVNVLGLAVGMLSTLYVYPMVLKENGLVRMLYDTGMVLFSMMTLSANTVAIRFFPIFQDKNKQHNGFLPLLMLLTFCGCLFFGPLIFLFKHWFIRPDHPNAALLDAYFYLAIPLSCLYAFNFVLFNYVTNFKRIVVPSILAEFSQKLIVPLVLICVWQKWLPLGIALNLLVVHGFLVFLGLVFYIKWLGEWRWGNFKSFLKPDLRNSILKYIAFGVFSGLGMMIAGRSDLLMVGAITTVEFAGIFAISAQLAAIIEIPIKGIYAASVSSVTRYLEDDNRKELGDLYQKVSINLLVSGLLLFFSIWISMDGLYKILPNGEMISAGKWVFFFIGLSRLVEMTTGINNYIIYYSKYYPWSIVFLVISAIFTVLLNLWLIPKIGMVGAAIATFSSITAYNIFSIFLVYRKYKLQPFTKNTIFAILLALVAYSLVYFIPYSGNVWFDMFVHSGMYATLFVVLVLLTKVAPDMSDLAMQTLRKLKKNK
jgi:O-antigen/teichoic acid export membrane protein